jgi:hypothetical protein
MSKEQFVDDEFTPFISYQPQWLMAHPPYFNIKKDMHAKEGDKYVFWKHASEAETQQTTHYLEIFLVEALKTFWLLFERDPIYTKT